MPFVGSRDGGRGLHLQGLARIGFQNTRVFSNFNSTNKPALLASDGNEGDLLAQNYRGIWGNGDNSALIESIPVGPVGGHVGGEMVAKIG